MRMRYVILTSGQAAAIFVAAAARWIVIFFFKTSISFLESRDNKAQQDSDGGRRLVVRTALDSWLPVYFLPLAPLQPRASCKVSK